MQSPLYVLAAEAESALNSLKKTRRVTLDPSADDPRSPAEPQPIDCSTLLTNHVDYQHQRWQLNALSPASEADDLRVDASARNSIGKRLDPYAIELIEYVVSKGVGILSCPLFPYTFSTEPLRCMEIRTHLLCRYSPYLPRNANLATRVAVTEKLLACWGAKLVKKSYPQVSDATVTPHSPWQASAEPVAWSLHHTPNNFAPPVSTSLKEVVSLVSPLKRKSKSQPAVVSNLTPFIAPRHELLRVDKFSPSTMDPLRAGTIASAPTAATPLAEVIPATRKVPSKDLLVRKLESMKTSKTKKKKTLQSGESVRRLVRRWTVQDRQLLLVALETHGFGATDAIRRMIPGKSYEQIHKVSCALQDDFGIKAGEGPTDEMRACLK